MVLPVLAFLKEQKIAACTVVLPVPEFPAPWEMIVNEYAVDELLIGSKEETGILWFPSAKGLKLDSKGLEVPMIAYRLCFDKKYSRR